MSELKIAGNPLPGMPWEERPEGCKNVMWRCSANPIIPQGRRSLGHQSGEVAVPV